MHYGQHIGHLQEEEPAVYGQDGDGSNGDAVGAGGPHKVVTAGGDGDGPERLRGSPKPDSN
eukprot:1386440-Pleurochrysis_carterae.AAC.1